MVSIRNHPETGRHSTYVEDVPNSYTEDHHKTCDPHGVSAKRDKIITMSPVPVGACVILLGNCQNIDMNEIIISSPLIDYSALWKTEQRFWKYYSLAQVSLFHVLS